MGGIDESDPTVCGHVWDAMLHVLFCVEVSFITVNNNIRDNTEYDFLCYFLRLDFTLIVNYLIISNDFIGHMDPCKCKKDCLTKIVDSAALWCQWKCTSCLSQSSAFTKQAATRCHWWRAFVLPEMVRKYERKVDMFHIHWLLVVLMFKDNWMVHSGRNKPGKSWNFKSNFLDYRSFSSMSNFWQSGKIVPQLANTK